LARERSGGCTHVEREELGAPVKRMPIRLERLEKAKALILLGRPERPVPGRGNTFPEDREPGSGLLHVRDPLAERHPHRLSFGSLHPGVAQVPLELEPVSDRPEPVVMRMNIGAYTAAQAARATLLVPKRKRAEGTSLLVRCECHVRALDVCDEAPGDIHRPGSGERAVRSQCQRQRNVSIAHGDDQTIGQILDAIGPHHVSVAAVEDRGGRPELHLKAACAGVGAAHARTGGRLSGAGEL
jgi:hypothetical protein